MLAPVPSFGDSNELRDFTAHVWAGPSVPRRIVTGMPALAEMVVELLGGDERIVGVSEFTDFPVRLKTKTSIGPYQKMNLEVIQGLKPDLVLVSRDGNSKDQIEKLRELGDSVVVLSSQDLAETRESIRILAVVLGLKDQGKAKLKFWDEAILGFQQRAKGRVMRTVLFEVGDDPLIVAGGNSFLSKILSLIGSKNIYADLRATYPRVAREDVLKRNPDWIWVLALHGVDKTFDCMVERWLSFGHLNAVQKHRVKVLHSDALLRPSFRLLDGIRDLENRMANEAS